MAKAELTEKDALFVVGSLYLAGEVREKLIKEFTNID
jgi:folylpolyglutamate synthase/dihydropteroate synthase